MSDHGHAHRPSQRIPRGTRLRANPPWADYVLAESRDRIANAFGEKALPRETDHAYVEYGCGTFGCVYPTALPGIVLKITRDVKEAEFIHWALREDTWPAGMTLYHTVISGPRSPHVGADCYFIWREEAEAVGHVDEWAAKHGKRMAGEMFSNAINALYDSIEKMSDYALEKTLHELVKLPFGAAVFDAIRFYQKRGAVLVDVHMDNVGIVLRRKRPTVVITDPGAASWKKTADPPSPFVHLDDAAPEHWKWFKKRIRSVP